MYIFERYGNNKKLVPKEWVEKKTFEKSVKHFSLYLIGQHNKKMNSTSNTQKNYKKYNQFEKRKKSTCEKAKRERERDCEKKARRRLNESKSTAKELMVAVKCARRRIHKCSKEYTKCDWMHVDIEKRW